VLGAIATTFGKADVSLKSVIQTHRDAEARAEIVAITHRVTHAKIQTALEAFGNLDVVDKIRNVIRVENE
jgi:homoserine dehydrogenase